MIHPYVFPGLIATPLIKTFDPAEFIYEVCDSFGVTQYELVSQTRRRVVVEARQIAFKIMREQKMTLTAIARMFGKDHTTVLHGLATINDLIEHDERLKFQYLKLRQAA